MTANRLVVGAVVVLALVAAVDALRSGAQERPRPDKLGGFRIQLASSREGTWLPPDSLRRAFPGREPPSIAISKVAVADDEVVAVGISHVPGDRPAQAAVELWEGERLVRAFPVPPGSFSRGLWFAGDGRVIATIGSNGRGYLYDRDGHRVRGRAYFAFETG